MPRASLLPGLRAAPPPGARRAPPRLLPASVAALAAALVGCAPPPAMPEFPATRAAAGPAPVPPPGPPLPALPALPAGPPLQTEDSLVRVPRPLGDGWECAVERVVDPRQRVTVSFVQCRLPTPRGMFSLMAKDYQVPPDSVASAETLSTVEYPKHYRKRYDQVVYTRSGPVDHRGYPAYECEIELTKQDAAIHVIERVVVVGTHTLNISAQGPTEVFPAFAAGVRRWFDGVDFAALRGDPMRQAMR